MGLFLVLEWDALVHVFVERWVVDEVCCYVGFGWVGGDRVHVDAVRGVVERGGAD